MEDTNKPFGVLLKELIESSNFSPEEFETRMNNDLEQCPHRDQIDIGGTAPSVEIVKMMCDVLKPSREDEMILFRALAPLIAADESKGFNELVSVCRMAIGLTLKDVGAKLNSKIPNDDYEPAVRVALYEMGVLYPDLEESEALAEIYVIPPEEHSIFTNKVSSTRQGKLQVVDESYVPSTGPDDEDIENAVNRVEAESKKHNDFIVSEAAKILEEIKDTEE